MRARTYSKREVQTILRNNNYKPTRQTGSHIIYENDKKNHITIRAGGCNKMVFRRIIKENNLVI